MVIVTKSSILDCAAVLDPPLLITKILVMGLSSFYNFSFCLCLFSCNSERSLIIIIVTITKISTVATVVGTTSAFSAQYGIS